jgi:hypothetical protein
VAHKVHQVRLALSDHKVHKVLLVLQVLLVDHKVLKVRKVHRALQEQLVLLVLKDRKV